MAVDKRTNKQILVTFPNELVEEIEIYWHENSLNNRSDAIRELIKMGLESGRRGDSNGEGTNHR